MSRKKSLLKATVTAVGVLEVINRVIDSMSAENSNTKTGGKYYHWKHGDVYYRTFGEKGKAPLLLLHDLTVGSSHFEWLHLAKQLSDSYRVYCVDLVGCGKSEKPGITYTNYFYVQMLTDFVNEVIGEKTDVAATGLTGSFVLMANRMNHELFNQIMLVSPTSLSTLKKTPDDKSKCILKLFELPVIGKTLYYMLTNRSNIEYYLTEQCYFNSFHMNPSVTKSYYDAAHTGNGNGKYLLASLQSNYLYTDITTALRETENRVLLVTGDQNPNAADLAKSYLAVNPNLVTETISGSNLLPQLESEEEMLELLYHF